MKLKRTAHGRRYEDCGECGKEMILIDEYSNPNDAGGITDTEHWECRNEECEFDLFEIDSVDDEEINGQWI